MGYGRRKGGLKPAPKRSSQPNAQAERRIAAAARQLRRLNASAHVLAYYQTDTDWAPELVSSKFRQLIP